MNLDSYFVVWINHTSSYAWGLLNLCFYYLRPTVPQMLSRLQQQFLSRYKVSDSSGFKRASQKREAPSAPLKIPMKPLQITYSFKKSLFVGTS